LKKYFNANQTHNWIHIINRVVTNINNTENSGIKAISQEIYDGQDINHQAIRPRPSQLKIGDKVRIKNKNITFNKHIAPYSNRVYTSESLDGIGYLLSGQSRKFFYSELKLKNNGSDVNSTTQQILRNNRINRRLRAELH
jgi:hypothetical protein